MTFDEIVDRLLDEFERYIGYCSVAYIMKGPGRERPRFVYLNITDNELHAGQLGINTTARACLVNGYKIFWPVYDVRTNTVKYYDWEGSNMSTEVYELRLRLLKRVFIRVEQYMHAQRVVQQQIDINNLLAASTC